MLGGQNQIHIEYLKTSDIFGLDGLNLGESGVGVLNILLHLEPFYIGILCFFATV